MAGNALMGGAGINAIPLFLLFAKVLDYAVKGNVSSKLHAQQTTTSNYLVVDLAQLYMAGIKKKTHHNHYNTIGSYYSPQR